MLITENIELNLLSGAHPVDVRLVKTSENSTDRNPKRFNLAILFRIRR